MAFDGPGKKKKFTVIGLAVILVVGAVVGTIVTVNRHKEVQINTRKAGGMKTGLLVAGVTVYLLCKYTDFRKVCEQTINRIGTGLKDPRALVKTHFSEALELIQGAIEKSYAVRQAAKDPMAARAVDTCKELLDCSIEDLKRSLDRVGIFDISKTRGNVYEMRVWLSGAVTFQSTCLDGFQNTTGDSGLLMTKLLDVGITFTRNSLAILDGFADLLDGKNDRNINILPQPAKLNPEPVQTQETTQIQQQQQQQQQQIEQQQQQQVQQQQQQQPYSVNWKADVTIKQTQSGGTSTNAESKPMAGNRRMLDHNEDEGHVHDSKLQMVGDQSNGDDIPTPESKPVMPNEPKTPYPSWADTSRRSLFQADPKTMKPNAVVAQDGSGNFKTIMEAVNTAPQKSPEPFVIQIKAGVYQEYVMIPRHTNNVVFLGEGPATTKITGNKNFVDGVGTYQTPTVAVNGDGFMAKDIMFENTAGPQKHQAVALRVSADMSIFHNCVMDAFQDTLYTHSYRQFYRQCTISGTVDFIFGDAAAVFQDCKMIVKKPMDNQQCMVTAQGRKDHHSVGGLVFDGCTISAAPDFMSTAPMPKSFLGRPWKEFSRTIIMQSFIDKNIVPEGWSPWMGNFGLDTCYYAELNNKGPGADTSKRVTWKGYQKMFNPRDAQQFAPGKYLQGDTWIPGAGVPYDAGLMKV